MFDFFVGVVMSESTNNFVCDPLTPPPPIAGCGNNFCYWFYADKLHALFNAYFHKPSSITTSGVMSVVILMLNLFDKDSYPDRKLTPSIFGHANAILQETFPFIEQHAPDLAKEIAAVRKDYVEFELWKAAKAREKGEEPKYDMPPPLKVKTIECPATCDSPLKRLLVEVEDLEDDDDSDDNKDSEEEEEEELSDPEDPLECLEWTRGGVAEDEQEYHKQCVEKSKRIMARNALKFKVREERERKRRREMIKEEKEALKASLPPPPASTPPPSPEI